MPVDRIEVLGLRDLQRELRALDRTLPRELRKANLEAAEAVADATRASFASRPGVAPKVAASVKALAQQRNASVRIGGAKYPYALGSNFGSHRFKQFPPPVSPDHSLYKSIRAKRDKIKDTHLDAIDRLAKRAFPR